MPLESRYSYGILENRRSAGTPPAFTGAPPGHYRRRPGWNRGVAVALPGSDAGIDTVSAGGVTAYRCSAWTLSVFFGAQLGQYRRQPGLCRDAAGFHRGTTGDNRCSDGASPG
ncbi:hypothetical protein DPMN_187246 [Dreissena polymorpha]|uniref:Uncharacterized protein n=1 Tax=Dreissena polymorpha TaxID=45954 RepID=A0A9D4DQ70_DREPO|nr:hypothetical protein DPMN_187246 [Dreissena polymorpha]